MAFFRLFKISTRISTRNFMMSARLKSEQVLEELKEKNPYFEKYAAKISKLQSTNPEELLNR